MPAQKCFWPGRSYQNGTILPSATWTKSSLKTGASDFCPGHLFLQCLDTRNLGKIQSRQHLPGWARETGVRQPPFADWQHPAGRCWGLAHAVCSGGWGFCQTLWGDGRREAQTGASLEKSKGSLPCIGCKVSTTLCFCWDNWDRAIPYEKFLSLRGVQHVSIQQWVVVPVMHMLKSYGLFCWPK